MFLPCVPELLGYLKGVADFNAPLSFLKNVGTLLLTGSPWNKSGLTNTTPYMEYFSVGEVYPLVFQVAIMLAIALLTLGIFRLWVIEPKARWIVTVLVFPGC